MYIYVVWFQKYYHIYILCVCVCVRVGSELEFVLGGDCGDWGTIVCFSSDIIKKKQTLLFCFIYKYIYKVSIKNKAIKNFDYKT